MPELTITEWAAIQNPPISRQAAHKRIKSGKVKLNANGKIDVEAAAKQWESNKDVRQQQRGAPSAKAKAAKSDDIDPHSLAAAQRTEAWLKVKEKKLKIDRAEGALLPKADVEQAWSSMISAARSRLLLLPDKVAHKLASSSDVLECREILDKGIKEALTALSEDPTGAQAEDSSGE